MTRLSPQLVAVYARQPLAWFVRRGQDLRLYSKRPRLGGDILVRALHEPEFWARPNVYCA